MSINAELTEAWQYTKSLFTRLKDLIVLIVVMCIPLVDLMAVGYYTRVLRDSSASKTPPKFADFKELFLSGLKFLLVFVFWFIFVALIQIAKGGFSMSWVGNPDEYIESLLGLVILGVTMFVVSIFGVMSIVHMFKQKSFKKAFAFKEHLDKIAQIGWVRYIVFLVYVYVTVYVLSLFMLLPLGSGIFGMVAGFIVVAALSVVPVILYVRTMSNLYDNAIVQSEIPPPPPPL